MKKQISTQKQTEVHAAHAAQHQGEHVFENVETLLRFDATQHPVPPTVGDRLSRSADEEPSGRARRPWWTRIFGG